MSERLVMRLSCAGDPAAGLSSIGYSFPDQVVSGEPVESAHVFYDRPLGAATIGIWESQAGTVNFGAYPFDELCMLVDGEVALIGTSGQTEVFRSGDVFLVPKGWSGDWVMHRPARKFYVELKD